MAQNLFSSNIDFSEKLIKFDQSIGLNFGKILVKLNFGTKSMYISNSIFAKKNQSNLSLAENRLISILVEI